MRQGARRGANALEFVLTLPVLLILLSGIVDYSYLLHMQFNLVNTVSQGARAASSSDFADATGIATQVVQEIWTHTYPDTSATISAQVVTIGSVGDVGVRVEASVPYQPLVGLIPVPSTVEHTAVMRLDDQP